MERSYSPAARYPFFKKVENYYHSPVFTPPRKLFRPAHSKPGDKIETVFLQGPSTMELPVSTEAMDVCSQVLFSGSQESSMSQSLSVRHRECSTSVQEDQNIDQDKVLPNSSCSTSEMFCQSINCEENLDEQAKRLESGRKLDRPMATQIAQSPASGNMYQPSTLDTKVKEGSHSDEQLSSSHSKPSQSIAIDNSQIEKGVEGTQPVSMVSLQSCEKRGRSASLSPDTSTSAHIHVGVISRPITSTAKVSGQLISEPAKILNSSKQDDSTSLESLEEEYKTFSASVEEGGRSLEALKQNLKKLQQALKDEAQKIQQQRGHIMSCDPEKMSESQQQLQKQELFNLSKKQKHLLNILNIHKRASSNLTIKEMQVQALKSDVTRHQRATLPSNETNANEVCQTPCREKTPGGHDQDPPVVKTKEERPVDNPSVPMSIKDGTDHNDATQDMDSQSTSQLSQNAAIHMPMPQLAVKDLVENGFLKPSQGCMSFVYEGTQISGDLQPDGSILSDGALYKTEKEWFISVCGQPATSIRKPKLWNLIKYNSTPLKAFADQCQLLSLAKKIEVPKAAMTKTTVASRQDNKADCPSSLKPTLNISFNKQEKKLQSRGHFDPSMIKSVVLIGNNELFSEDDLLTNGFWENTEAPGSLVPLQWLKEINSWEE
ncbi:hypothetical protein HOLleu_10088 [Holothuria leucospilota]|uniref:RAMA domain-containing protein n=1 Tax=Holothuria leucospilota TaxID=206669 RepID=A0A9Q1HFF9_HOLLE|nr:hypothetical protein HOLleu_10088 [Holothuria leucospilota]